MATQLRAGRYIKQPNRYSAFMPEPLPPVPPIDIDGTMQTMLSKAELPISVRLIREIHERLMQGVRGNHANPGELRRSQNWIGPGGSTLNDAVFVPPPPHEVERLLSDLEKFVHDESDIPALIKIGLIHAQFETIHPFLDGNGRVGRLLIAFYLCQKDILLKPVLYLSHWFKLHRARYYELLQNIRDKGEWEEWIKFFLEGVASVSLEATETARKIVALREDHRRIITDRFGRSAGNGLKILEDLYTNPYINTSIVRQKLRISFPPAIDLLQRFVDANILTEITGRERYRMYQYFPYVRLFSDVGR